METFKDILARHLALSLAKQQALAEYLGDHTWELDLQQGVVDFGRGRVFPVQILGTESEKDNTWLWGWANPMSGLPEEVLLDAERLREYGMRHEIRMLSEPRLPLADIAGHALALVASGVCGADAYYRAPYEGGAIYFLIHDAPLNLEFAERPDLVVSSLSRAIQLFEVDHRAVARAWMNTLLLEVEESGSQLIARKEGRTFLLVRFDGAGRIIGIDALAGEA
ncbi:MAG: hypothetical protein DI596_00010 [Azospira oryzae]|nr:MAG: hypothetical protein DI596_00010 [Azospira oryzae]PZP68810.1 MAG: hypothetical protein DI604_18855 [Delftia acidovorans]PZP83081.1 MAG: hypothetical protein DI593_00010 [Azospira oryzae]